MGLKQKQREEKLKETKVEIKRSFSPKRPQPPTTLPLAIESTISTTNKIAVRHEITQKFVSEALREAVSDFVNYLDSAKEKNERPMYRSAARYDYYFHYIVEFLKTGFTSTYKGPITNDDMLI